MLGFTCPCIDLELCFSPVLVLPLLSLRFLSLILATLEGGADVKVQLSP